MTDQLVYPHVQRTSQSLAFWPTRRFMLSVYWNVADPRATHTPHVATLGVRPLRLLFVAVDLSVYRPLW